MEGSGLAGEAIQVMPHFTGEDAEGPGLALLTMRHASRCGPQCRRLLKICRMGW